MVAGKTCDTNADQEIMRFAEKDLRIIMDYKMNSCQHLTWYCEEVPSVGTYSPQSLTNFYKIAFTFLPFQLFTLSSDPKKQNNSDWKEAVVELLLRTSALPASRYSVPL